MLLCVFLLYCVLQESSCCTVERGLGPTISKSVGDSVVLPCFCENLQDDPQEVKWGYKKQIIGGDYKADHSVFPEDTSQNQRYRDRVQRLNQKPGDLSLTISHLTEEDEGTYLCGNEKYNRAVVLYVRGCSVLDVTARTFTGSPGESVLLPCPCPNIKEKIEPQSVTWTKDGTAVSNHTESYRGRVWTFDQTHSRNISLLISDLSKEDAGLYTCTADKNLLYVRLQVKGCALSENKQTVPVSRSSGESVLLSCSCTDLQDTPPPVQWRTPNHEDLHQRYRDRVQTFNQSSPGNLSVLISDLTAEDGGTYSCWINQNQYRNFILTVKVQNTVNQLRDWKTIIITICTVLLLLLGGAAYTYWKCGKGSKQSDENEAARYEETDGDYQNDLPGNKNEISMGSVYQNLDPKTNQSDSVYQSLDPKTNQSDSVYQSLDPKTNQSDSVYESLDPKTNQSDLV